MLPFFDLRFLSKKKAQTTDHNLYLSDTEVPGGTTQLFYYWCMIPYLQTIITRIIVSTIALIITAAAAKSPG